MSDSRHGSDDDERRLWPHDRRRALSNQRRPDALHWKLQGDIGMHTHRWRSHAWLYWSLAGLSAGCVSQEHSFVEASVSTKMNPARDEQDDQDGGTAPLRIRIEDGELEGRLLDGGVRSFLGIPYAKPPIDTLRWKPPQKNDPWLTLRDASTFGPRCAQLASSSLPSTASDNEDCLYLNVWAPSPAVEEALPVLVWIHDGGHSSGSASEPVPATNLDVLYDGMSLAQKQHVIVVSFNYRLGLFGFFAHPALDREAGRSGNQGLWDQQLALSWVQENIAAFGGDPQRVTLFGSASGAIDVCLHVASPASRGLFQQAISQSGGCTTRQRTVDEARQRAKTLVANLACTDDALPCLRAKSTRELLEAAARSAFGSTLGPVVDGVFMPQQPRDIYDAAAIAPVAYLIGSNTDEGAAFLVDQPEVSNADDVRALLTRTFSISAAQIMVRYPTDQFASAVNPAAALLGRILGDARVGCPTTDTALRAAHAGLSVHMYNFALLANPPAGSTHGAELGYVFGTRGGFTSQTQRVSDRVQGYWANFARTGDPNGGLLNWPEFSAANDLRMNFGLNSKIVARFRSDECAFWRAHDDQAFAAVP